ncbi:MAG TPA: hypothetical protein VFS26_10150 [Solirubrobacterales bacterium]|nr:hypothetical protein [Solirubrobacterales bacterium]
MSTAVKQRESKSESGTIERTAELSEQVLEQVKEGQESAIEAVRKFMSSVDEALPPHGEGRSQRQQVIDSALEMSEQLVHSQYAFLSSVVHSAREAARSNE